MRTPDELERLAFKETLTCQEDDLLVDRFMDRGAAETAVRKRTPHLKQAAFFAARAFDKGAREPETLAKYSRLLTEVQRIAPSSSFRRKLMEIKSVLAGKDSHGAALKKLARRGRAYGRDVLATDAELDGIQTSLGVILPPSYRTYLKLYSHRQIGTYEPYTTRDLVEAAQEAWSSGLEPYLLPFLEDNADHFCFDMRSNAEEPAVVFRPHDGTSEESWPNFAAWVEECWLAEEEEQ